MIFVCQLAWAAGWFGTNNCFNYMGWVWLASFGKAYSETIPEDIPVIDNLQD